MKWENGHWYALTLKPGVSMLGLENNGFADVEIAVSRFHPLQAEGETYAFGRWTRPSTDESLAALASSSVDMTDPKGGARGAGGSSSPVVAADSLVVPVVWGGLSLVSSVVCAIHGTRRNDSAAWGLAWFVGGAVFPVLMPALAIGQGFGKRKNPRRRRRRARS